MPQVLITGAGGLVGHALRGLLPGARFAARADADLTDLAAVERLFEETRPEKVVHLAADVGGVKKNAARNADLLASNALINTHVLNVAARRGVSRLVSVLSSCAYAFYPDRPTTESDLHIGLPFAGNLGYGYSKRMLDVQTHLLAEQYGCRFSTITPATIFGPNDDWDLEDGHVLGSLIHKCFLAKRDGKPLEVWGSGRAVRQFVYSRDVARVLVAALDSFDGPGSTIVSDGPGITIGDLARAVARAMDFDGPIVFDASKPEGALVRVIKSEAFERRFPGFMFTRFEDALRETARWFADNAGDCVLSSAGAR
ncbi:MAG TPA: NAD-dependent epimerase/dehydratase family protein [Elusimicrobiota bacterium]|nr:NAD-dependent epimerase/dehydratase family protein [Elusimicrobiota bacterium]